MAADVGFKWYGEKVLKQARKAVGDVIHATAIEMVGNIRESMGGKRFGSFKARVTVETIEYDIYGGQRAGKKQKLKKFRRPSPPGHPPAVQTGRLTSSIKQEFSRRRLTARIGTNIKYGKYLELGVARPYWIYPKTGKVLAWMGDFKAVKGRKPKGQGSAMTAGMVFATRVRHPGTRARPFLRPAMDRAWPKLKKRLKGALKG